MRPEILVTDPVEPRLDAALEEAYVVHRPWHANAHADFVAEACANVQAVVTRSMVGADRSLMAALPRLEIIALFGAGTDAVDLAAARELGIRVTNTADVLTEDTADYGMALLLALARKLVDGDRFLRSGKWPDHAFPNSTRIGGKKLGIVGLGRIGSGIARRARAFSLEVLYTGPTDKKAAHCTYVPSLIDLATRSDFLILSCPGGADTSGIINAEVLDALGPEGMLINIARASVVDETALIAALENNRIKAAALDVFADEPYTPERLLSIDKLIVEPHIASKTVETRAAICDLVFANLDAYFSGQPLPKPVV